MNERRLLMVFVFLRKFINCGWMVVIIFFNLFFDTDSIPNLLLFPFWITHTIFFLLPESNFQINLLHFAVSSKSSIVSLLASIFCITTSSLRFLERPGRLLTLEFISLDALDRYSKAFLCDIIPRRTVKSLLQNQKGPQTALSFFLCMLPSKFWGQRCHI